MGQPAAAWEQQPHSRPPLSAQAPLEEFTIGGMSAGFRVVAHYTDHAEQVMGLQLTHLGTGTPVHLLQMETVPQAAVVIRTYPHSDHGAAHALEHLLLGKGTTGRYLQALADMRLGRITAGTAERFTWYHFAVDSGMASFIELLTHLLEALFRPDFGDAEAQQEVYQVGVAMQAQTGQRWLTEQGTVYTEMHSQQGLYDYWYALLKRVLGPDHPLTFQAGGTAGAIRHLTPQDIRQFHGAHYVLGPNTPLVLVVDRQQAPAMVLSILDEILAALPRTGDRAGPVATMAQRTRIRPAADKALQLVPSPGLHSTDPAMVVFGWKPARLPSLADRLQLDAFLSVFGTGIQSILYRSVVDRQSRDLETQAAETGSLLLPTYDPEWPVSLVWLEGIPGDRLTRERLEAIRAHVQAKLHEVASYADGSGELLAFNRQVISHLLAAQRALTVWHMTPPGFGQRRLDPTWIEHLERLAGEPSGRKSLVLQPYWSQLLSEIESGRNLWRDMMERAGLLEIPYGAASVPAPALRHQLAQEKQARLDAALAALQQHYGTVDAQEALRRYEADSALQHEPDAAGAHAIALPTFTAQPPQTFDDTLPYAQYTIAEAPIVESYIEGAALTEIGLAFDLRSVPRHLYRYLPLLPGVLRTLGLRQGEAVTRYDAFEEQVRRDVYRLETSYSINPAAQRYELTITAGGIGREEFLLALEYLRRITQGNNLHPDNLARLSDLVQQSLSAEKTWLQRPEEEWVETLATAFRYQHDHLFLSLNAQPTRLHHWQRLAWLLAGPVTAEVLLDLQRFASQFLASLRTSSVAEMEQRLAGLQEVGLRGQLVDYWRAHLYDWPPSLVWQGLQRLSVEVVADLQVGHVRVIQEIRELQALILNRARLRLWLVGDSRVLQQAHMHVAALVQSFPHTEVDVASAAGTPVVWHHLRARDPHLTMGYPAYVGYVHEGSVTGSIIVTAKGPRYGDDDSRSAVEVLAGKLLAGTAPHTWYKQTWDAGLAYGNGLDVRPRDGTLLYYADRCPSVRATLSFVRSLAQEVSRLAAPPYVDYALAQTFAFSRAALSASARAEGLAIDLAEGVTPEQMRGFSQTLLHLRQDAQLVDRLREALPQVVAKVTLGQGSLDLKSAAQSLFFIIAPDQQLRELDGSGERWVRVWPSDFWLE
jgi:Zn-dependent M16 (insulinase) family peptidase